MTLQYEPTRRSQPPLVAAQQDCSTTFYTVQRYCATIAYLFICEVFVTISSIVANFLRLALRESKKMGADLLPPSLMSLPADKHAFRQHGADRRLRQPSHALPHATDTDALPQPEVWQFAVNDLIYLVVDSAALRYINS